MNLLEIREDIVHADGGNGDDHTLCGVTSERVLDDISEYTYDVAMRESELVPCMVYTERKIDCPTCATIIRHCCKLGLRSIKRRKMEGEARWIK